MSELHTTPSEATTAPVAAAAPVVDESQAFAKDDPVKAEPAADAGAVAAAPAAAPAPAVIDGPAPLNITSEEKVNKDEVKLTAAPVTAGNLAYKGPGLLNQIRAKHHYFFLGSEPVPIADLQQIKQSEGDDAKHNVAWASSTGKGLLFYSKREEDKATPTGIINLASATEIAKQGNKSFSFLINKHKHTFEAPEADRNGWVVAIENASEEAKASKESIVNSEKYQSTHSELFKPAPAAAATAAAGTGAVGVAGAAAAIKKHEDNKEADTEPQEAAEPVAAAAAAPAEAKPEEKRGKSRSQSRKRQSIFGSLLGKKEPDEKKEAEKAAKEQEKAAKKEEEKAAKEQEKTLKKEEKKEDKAAATAEKEEKKQEAAEQKAEEHESKKVAAAETADKHDGAKEAVVAGTAATGVAAAGVAAAEHNSSSAKPTQAERQTNPVELNVAAHDGYVAHNGIRNVGGTSTCGVDPLVATSANGSQKSDNLTSKANKRKSGLLNLFSKSPNTEKSEAEGGLAPPAATEGKESAVAQTPAVSETVAAPAEAAAAKPEDKRRSSFFGLGSVNKKEVSPARSPVEKVEKTEKTEKNEKAGGVGAKINDLFRRNSKAQKSSEAPKKEEVAAQPAVAEETVPSLDASTAPAASSAAHTTPALGEPTTIKPEEVKPMENGAVIGDVVPEAITVGQAQTTSAPLQTVA